MVFQPAKLTINCHHGMAWFDSCNIPAGNAVRWSRSLLYAENQGSAFWPLLQHTSLLLHCA
jgi:hypothetical protein